ncbi:MAG: hypothetical protein OHK0029_21350 [Armatimonadaceae bacterium]
MAILPDMVGIVVADMAKALAFYRLLGLDIPTGVEEEPYVEVITPNGYRISWNMEAMVQGFDPDGNTVDLFAPLPESSTQD